MTDAIVVVEELAFEAGLAPPAVYVGLFALGVNMD